MYYQLHLVTSEDINMLFSSVPIKPKSALAQNNLLHNLCLQFMNLKLCL